MLIPVADIPGYINVGQEYDSPLPPASEMLGALANPVAGYLLDPDAPEGLGRLMLDDALNLVRSVMARGGTQVGIPNVYLDAFDDVLTAAVSGDVTQLATTAAATGIDLAFNALGAVPVVGWLASGALRVVELMIQVGKLKEPPRVVPLATYSLAANDWYASRALDVVGDAGRINTDWTPLFDVPGTGPWEGIKAEPAGHVFQLRGAKRGDPSVGDQLGSGKALVPGTGLGLLSINAVSSEPRSINELAIAYAAYFIESRSWDKSDKLPSFLRVGVSAWQAAQTRTPSMFQIHVGNLANRWRRYVGGALDVIEAFETSNAKNPDVRGERRNDGYIARTQLYDVDLFQRFGQPLYIEGSEEGRRFGDPHPANPYWDQHEITKRKDILPKSKRLDRIAGEKLLALYNRQKKAMDTLMVAYCSEKQPAFRDKSLADKLRTRRQQLLEDPAVQDVDLDSVIDEDYRSELYTARMMGGFKLTAKPGSPKVARPFWPLDRIPQGQLWDPSGRGGRKSAPGWLKLAALAALGYGAYKVATR